jgi:Septum formation
MSTPNPPWDGPVAPQQSSKPQGYSYPNPATPIPPAYPVYPMQYYPYPAPPPRSNWWAVVSFILGLVGVFVLSVICGLVGLSQAKRVGSGRGFAIAGLVLSGLWLLPFAAIVVYGVTSGLTSDTDIVSAEKVEVGDCLAEVPEEGRVETVETVDCQKPHAGEVYAQLAAPDRNFPGEDAIVERYASKCEPVLASYSSAAAQDMSISLIYLHPTQETWERGDRAVHCIAVTSAPRSGSIKG